MKFGLSTGALAMVVAAAGVAPSAPAAAADRPGLAPGSPWNLQYDDDSCVLRRLFGEGDDLAYIELRRFEPGLNLQAIVASNRMKARNPARFRYRFGDDREWRDAYGNALVLVDGFSGVLFFPSFVYLPDYDAISDTLERDAYVRSIDWREVERSFALTSDKIILRGAFRSELTLQLGPLDKPMAALNTCIDELMSHWGIDVEAHKSLTRPALPTNLREVPKMMDYPPEMVRRNMPGLVNIRLAIDERGLITACHIQMPLSDPAFAASSCADIQHALEFDPALDEDGKPIPSYWVTSVKFELTP